MCGACFCAFRASNVTGSIRIFGSERGATEENILKNPKCYSVKLWEPGLLVIHRVCAGVRIQVSTDVTYFRHSWKLPSVYSKPCEACNWQLKNLSSWPTERKTARLHHKDQTVNKITEIIAVYSENHTKHTYIYSYTARAKVVPPRFKGLAHSS